MNDDIAGLIQVMAPLHEQRMEPVIFRPFVQDQEDEIQRLLAENQNELRRLSNRVDVLETEVDELKLQSKAEQAKKKSTALLEMQRTLQSKMNHHLSNIMDSRSYGERYEALYETLLNTLEENMKLAELKHKIITLFQERNGIQEYLYTLYWWILTNLQVFRLHRTRLIDMNSDILNNPINVQLKKIIGFTLKTAQIATGSMPGAAEASSVIHDLFKHLVEKIKNAKMQEAADKQAEIYVSDSEVLLEPELHLACIETAYEMAQTINMTKESKECRLSRWQRFKYTAFGSRKFTKEIVMFRLRKDFKNPLTKLAVFHSLLLMRDLSEHGSEKKAANESLASYFCRIILSAVENKENPKKQESKQASSDLQVVPNPVDLNVDDNDNF